MNLLIPEEFGGGYVTYDGLSDDVLNKLINWNSSHFSEFYVKCREYLTSQMDRFCSTYPYFEYDDFYTLSLKESAVKDFINYISENFKESGLLDSLTDLTQQLEIIENSEPMSNDWMLAKMIVGSRLSDIPDNFMKQLMASADFDYWDITTVNPTSVLSIYMTRPINDDYKMKLVLLNDKCHEFLKYPLKLSETEVIYEMSDIFYIE